MRQYILYIVTAVLTLAACSGESGGGGDDSRKPVTVDVHFYVQAPKADTGDNTRMGDPGESTAEGTDWDRIAVIIAYREKNAGGYDPEPKRMVYWDVFTRDEFMQTTPVNHTNSTLEPVFDTDGTDTGIRSFSMPLVRGTVRIYGITYSAPKAETNAGRKDNLVDFEARLADIVQDGTDHNQDIVMWQIPNAYASTDGTVKTVDVGKFLSVATGYAVDTKHVDSKNPDLSIDDSDVSQYWSMTLHRLAAKLDVQWDAQQAYDNTQQKYIDVDVDGFSYSGGATEDGPGYGRLFPFAELLYTGRTFTALGGKVDFFNTSAISRRNGRVYHYLFPDGCTGTAPVISFHITTYSQDAPTQSTSKDYQLNFKNVVPLEPAAWYKINARIRGNSSPTTDVLVNF